MLLASLVVAGPGLRAAADTSTPTAVPVPTAPTIVADTPPPVAEAPTAEQEQVTPLATSPPAPTEPPILAPSATPARVQPVRPVAMPTPLPTPLPPVSGAPFVSLPSPQELELNARLRWGKHIPPDVRRWAFLIVPAARKFHLSPNLIAAVMTMESGGDPLAWNPDSDARGLMQVLHGPWDPKRNIFRGARLLARYYAQFQDWTLALAAYNAGPNAVIEAGGVPPYRETRDYVIVVRYLWDLYTHRTITPRRKEQYRSTLKDLQRFANERKKILRLARVGQVGVSSFWSGPTCPGLLSGCGQQQAAPLLQTLDPFWLMGGTPDPLQRVDPYAALTR